MLSLDLPTAGMSIDLALIDPPHLPFDSPIANYQGSSTWGDPANSCRVYADFQLELRFDRPPLDRLFRGHKDPEKHRLRYQPTAPPASCSVAVAFRPRLGAASLKQPDVDPRYLRDSDSFRPRLGAASLKQHQQVEGLFDPHPSAPVWGGLIEAPEPLTYNNGFDNENDHVTYSDRHPRIALERLR